MEKIYLASKSPRRAELLARLNIPFEVISAEVDESVWGSPEECVCALAQRKAAAGAEKIGSGWVLAADTLVFLDGVPQGKPGTAERAKQTLRSLSGKTHTVMTGMCLRHTDGRSYTRCDQAQITFDEMTDDEISAYAASGEPLDKAGAYGIQGLGGQFIREISGDYYATVGLSLFGLRKILKQAGLTD